MVWWNLFGSRPGDVALRANISGRPVNEDHVRGLLADLFRADRFGHDRGVAGPALSQPEDAPGTAPAARGGTEEGRIGSEKEIAGQEHRATETAKRRISGETRRDGRWNSACGLVSLDA